MKTLFIISKSPGNGEFFWHAKRGSRIVADGGEGYKTKAKLKRTLDRFLGSIGEGNFEITEK